MRYRTCEMMTILVFDVADYPSSRRTQARHAHNRTTAIPPEKTFRAQRRPVFSGRQVPTHAVIQGDPLLRRLRQRGCFRYG